MAACDSNGTASRKNSDVNSTSALEQRFECPICLNFLHEPQLTSCGHKFCKTCIVDWLKKQGGRCPIDNAILADHDLFPDNYTKREINQQAVECTYCDKKLPLTEYDNHLTEMHEKSCKVNGIINGEGVIHCPFKNIGCHYSFRSPRQADSHVETLTQHHLQLVAASLETLNLKMSGSPNSLKDLENVNWDPPPKQDPSAESSVKNLIKSMYERIVVLEQKNAEQELHIKRANEKIAEILREKEIFEKELILKVCNGAYLWRIDNMKAKVRDLLFSNSPEESLISYSEGFYTSYDGYKFCAKIIVLPQQQDLSLHIHLLKGDNDNALSWPFSGRIAFTLIHPKYHNMNLREVMCSRSDSEAFYRPVKQMNLKGFGYPQFVTLQELGAKGYFNDDGSLSIKIKIDIA